MQTTSKSTSSSNLLSSLFFKDLPNKTNFRIITLNICGDLDSKVKKDHLQILLESTESDICIVTETHLWLHEGQSKHNLLFPNYIGISNGFKEDKQKRRGGVMIFVAKELEHLI